MEGENVTTDQIQAWMAKRFELEVYKYQCRLALEKISGSDFFVLIPSECVNELQKLALVIETGLWTIGTLITSSILLGLGIIVHNKFDDWAFGSSIRINDNDMWRRAQARVWVEEEMHNEHIRMDERGDRIYISPGGSYIDPNARRYTPEQRAEHRADFERANREKDAVYRAKLEERYGIADDTHVPQSSHQAPRQELVSSPSYAQRRDAKHRADKVEAVLASKAMPQVRIEEAQINDDEITFDGKITASATRPITENDILEHEKELEMTQGTSGGMFVKIVGGFIRIIFRRN